ncbi:glycosyltransferase family 2 protein [Patescibacteria group bacterium]|nr:glycosyltransferase family 2 protein [Patescibacteria group bacterium]
MPKNKLSINLVTYNAEKYIKLCLNSIFKQNFVGFEIIIVDNASSDKTISIIENDFLSKYQNIKLIKNSKNLGFANAHNIAINSSESEYILLLNQDIILEKNYIFYLIRFLDNNKNYSSCNGKLLKLKFDEKNNIIKTSVIDSLGLKPNLGYKFKNIAEGEIDSKKYDNDFDVWGVSGALPIYRRSSIYNVSKLKNNYYEIFDESFFMYKEDIDLAFRLKNFDLKSKYISSSIAYHERGLKNKKGLLKKMRDKKNNDFLNYLSYRNHLLLLYKNLNLKNFIIHFPFIFYEELKKFLYYVFYKPSIIKKSWNYFLKNKSKWLIK